MIDRLQSKLVVCSECRIKPLIFGVGFFAELGCVIRCEKCGKHVFDEHPKPMGVQHASIKWNKANYKEVPNA